MYTALYRAYRPEIFSEILGQEHIIRILKNQLATDSVSHAYLFCGTRGTGKTTTARILAKGVNCLAEDGRPCGVCENCRAIQEGRFMDVVEIDAASNNGVENIRELRESVKYPPATGRKKVYIIDEVHMLSTGAFNALLKTLEEPPENVMFILATTEPQKLPATILSRCMRLDFKRIPETVLTEGMDQICRQKGIAVSPDALRLIAANADGSVRDGLSILDQCISGGQEQISREDILEFLGTSGEEVFLELTDQLLLRKPSDALLLLDQVLADGKDVRQFMKDWLNHYRNLLMVKFIKNPADMLNLSLENTERLRRQSGRMDLPELNEAIIQLSRTMSEAKWSTQPRILLELFIVKLSADIPSVPAVRQPQPRPEAARNAAMPEAAKHTEPQEQRPVSQPGASGVEEDTARMDYEDSAAREKEVPTKEPEFDLDSLWHRIFEEAEASRGSFNLIRTGTRLTAIEAEHFFIEPLNEAVAGYVENNRETLENLMEKHTGKRRMLKCIKAGSHMRDAGKKNVEEIARSVEDKLGIKVEIE